MGLLVERDGWGAVAGKRKARRRGSSVAVLVLALLALIAAPLALAAVLARSGAAPSGHAGLLSLRELPGPRPLGADASWPQCAHPKSYPLPKHVAFAVLGVNDGVPGTRLSADCLRAELAWARQATGGTEQPALQFYLIAADPWQPAERRWHRPDWPRSNTVAGTRVAIPSAYGTRCTGSHTSRACAYVYGWWAAQYGAGIAGVAHPERFRYWLDVETERDFSSDRRFNEALIEGMAAYLQAAPADGGLGAQVGIYSNEYYWGAIVGELRQGSPLAGLDIWLPIGEASAEDALRAPRERTPFLPDGHIRMVQYVSGGVDWSVAIPAG